jgi:hypothetical protein
VLSSCNISPQPKPVLVIRRNSTPKKNSTRIFSPFSIHDGDDGNNKQLKENGSNPSSSSSSSTATSPTSVSHLLCKKNTGGDVCSSLIKPTPNIKLSLAPQSDEEVVHNYSSLGSTTTTTTITTIAAPKLTNPYYATSPPLAELKQYTPAQLQHVENFTITKYHPFTGEAVGSIRWKSEVDVSNIDLDDQVCIVNEINAADGKRRWYVLVYDNFSNKSSTTSDNYLENVAPPVGCKLNSPAVITFYGLYCKSKKLNRVEDYPAKLASFVQSIGGEFVSYESKRGSVTFEVPHFNARLNG